MKIAYYAGFPARIIENRASFKRSSATTAYYHYGEVGGLHTRFRVNLGSCPDVSAGPSLAVFWCWDLSDRIFVSRVMDARLVIYILHV